MKTTIIIETEEPVLTDEIKKLATVSNEDLAKLVDKLRAQRDKALLFLGEGCGGLDENKCLGIPCEKCPTVLAAGAK